MRSLKMGDLPKCLMLEHETRLPQNPSGDWTRALDAARWADRYAIIYPLWLNEPPALLRLFFQGVFASGIADKDCISIQKSTQKKARIVVTMDMPGFALRSMFRSGGGTDAMRDCLSFAGIDQPDVMFIGCVSTIPAEQRASWLKKLTELGADRK